MRIRQTNRIYPRMLGRALGPVIVLLIFFGFSCKKEESAAPTEAGTAESSVNPGSQQRPTNPPLASEPSTPPASATEPMATEPIDTEPIETKLDRVIGQAKETKEQYESFREKLFDQAFEQFETILCSTYRLQLLSGKDRDFYKKDPSLYLAPLRAILRRQGSPPFLDLVETDNPANSNTTLPALRKVKDIQASIPKSDPYSKRRRSIAELTLQEPMVAEENRDSLSSVSNGTEILESAAWHFDPLTKCEPSYLAPVANSSQARNESRENMAGLVASSLNNLRSYPQKLEVVEREWTRANDLRPILTNIKNTLGFNDIDPTVRKNVRSYEEWLTKAINDLSRAKAEGKINTAISPGEIRNVLAIFR
jgi:hypothetical protein